MRIATCLRRRITKAAFGVVVCAIGCASPSEEPRTQTAAAASEVPPPAARRSIPLVEAIRAMRLCVSTSILYPRGFSVEELKALPVSIATNAERGTLRIEAPIGFEWVYTHQVLRLFRRGEAKAISEEDRGAVIFPVNAVEIFNVECFESALVVYREKDLDR
jgi:hypothetical protein